MPRAILRLSHGLIIAALFLAIGGHFAMLQTVAWATMIVDYSRSGTLTEAVQKTFDGRHPCQLCTEIQKSRQSEKKQGAFQLVKEIQLFAQPQAEFVFAAAHPESLAVADSYADARSHAPPLPPPRSA